MPHAKAATKLFNKIVSAAESEGVLTADGLAERLIVFGVPEHRSWRLFDLLDDDGDEEVALDEFVRGFAHYTALVNEFTAEDGGTTELDIHQLPQECMTIVLSCLSAQSPAELARVARASSRLRAASCRIQPSLRQAAAQPIDDRVPCSSCPCSVPLIPRPPPPAPVCCVVGGVRCFP